jgi:putative salt-induced outer membrane protein YdiY
VLDAAPHTLRFGGGPGYLYEERPDEELRSATLSLAAAYRLAISATSEFTYEPRFLLPLAETERWKFDQEAALVVAVNTRLALKLSHTLRYSAEPPEGFATTDTIMAVSLVAKLERPR